MKPTFYCVRPVTQPYQLFQHVGFTTQTEFRQTNSGR